MSGAEEPPSKMSKYEEYLDENDAEEYLEEGQEEWLSEEMLTDDENHSNDNKNSTDFENNENNHNNMLSIPETDEEGLKNGVEDTLNNMDGKNDLPHGLGAYLIRKPDNKVVDNKFKKDDTVKKKQDDDDGNDTDDLLRLLEDGQQMKKKTFKMVKPQKTEEPETTDDEFVYEHSNMKNLKLPKNVAARRIAIKAVPESDSEGDQTDTSMESATINRMFGFNEKSQTSATKVINKVINKSTSAMDPLKDVHPSKDVNRKYMMGQINTGQNNNDNLKRSPKQGILKINKPKTESRTLKTVEIASPAKSVFKQNRQINYERDETMETEEIIDEEEFLEEDCFELNEEEFEEEAQGKSPKKQRIMRPEMMDEEVPSDEDSHSEEGSIYDELPSSDSEDIDDWFTLDIRAETAANYLPLLGSCAHSLLTAEKQRVAEKVASLRTSLTTLNESSRRQAESLRNASIALAEIDDTLRAA